ncbi:DUF4260 domain-containing protein [Tepidimicrobium xylanilyticum]|uniref:DUF4260 domain-containing protein n=1 Tax=Tepidimicrobium xylanilyticum TaxID=1123352 RepID=A0A1H2X7F1_9FIRM|nr:DUF4260 domain-containing protein [Tepidimicrobium xylanilyticum]GMG97423.1 hypothetical protein EN5CB1_22490 [Tepidimicrobium xylanilyticum]SDW88823.1 protein of unknown function [Tepidimicrobium xylanilyticum]
MTPKIWIRIEGALGFLLSLIIYLHLDFNMLVFFICLFLPDLLMLGYLVDNNVGAFFYNLGHVFVFPLILLLLAAITKGQIFIMAGLIWSAHIFLDRMIGYGLKYVEGFKITHLQKLD